MNEISRLFQKLARLTCIASGLALSLSPILADQEPEEIPWDITSTTDSCPGFGTCHQTWSAGDYYCDWCFWWGCGCQCVDGNILDVNYYNADCQTVTSGGTTQADCYNLGLTYGTTHWGTVCFRGC